MSVLAFQSVHIVCLTVADGLAVVCSQVTRERVRQIEAKAIRKLRARQTANNGLIMEYMAGELESKQLVARTSSGTKKT